MKLLITLNNPLELVIHETLSLAFALASFGHEIQLDISEDVATFLLTHPDHALTKMLSSLDLYDMPPAWIGADIYHSFCKNQNLPEALVSQLEKKPDTPYLNQFDEVLKF